MTPDRWRQITGVFHDALTRDAETRALFLEEVCVGDEALRAEVSALLKRRIKTLGNLARVRFLRWQNR